MTLLHTALKPLIQCLILIVLTSAAPATTASAQQAQTAEEPLIKFAPGNLAALPIRLELPEEIVVMNPDGDVTITEFFDYFCHACQRVGAEVQQVAAEDGNIRLVLREFPVLKGEESLILARIALAAYKQGIYREVHNDFMKAHGPSVETAVRIVQSHGGSFEQLKVDINDPAILDMIVKNVNLGTEKNLRATPSFMVEDIAMQGFPGREKMLEFVEKIRAERKGG